ncbi:MAG: Nif3-like dinuclear metal center hexameric protein, partial [Clostridia bacterium]|nr:Nif3-like dinuclear metal center hexameric protein [Clostridia bacterium]
LSDDYCKNYDGYDNSGVLIDCGEAVKKVLFSLDFSLSALDTAQKQGANVLITHHPAIYSKVGNILIDDVQGEKLQRAIRNKISVISMHLNVDCAKDGIDEELMRGVGGKQGEIQEPLQKEGCGYGRIYDVPPTTAGVLCEGIKERFSTQRAWCYQK